jgi:hypothetical protein
LGIVGLARGAWQIWIGASWPYGKSNAPIVEGSAVLSLAVAVITVGSGSLMLFVVLRAPVILTAETLRVPKGPRRISIPVQDIAGVGLVFKRNAGGTNRACALIASYLLR